MQTLTAPTTNSALGDRTAILRSRGFTQTADRWVHGDVAYHEADGWFVFSAPWPVITDPLRDAIGTPGLWKPVCDLTFRRMFAIHASWIADGETLLIADEESVFACVVDWALATANGNGLTQWSAPEQTVIESYLEKSKLTLVHHSFTRQLQIVHTPNRLALRVSILLALPADLPDTRMRWLQNLLLEAQNAHHLFRLGFAQEGAQTSVIAEVDLTGVPSILLEPLLSRSCDALRWVAAWLLEAAEFLAQADVASRALEICAAHQTKPTGEIKT